MNAKPLLITLAAALIAFASFKVYQLVQHARHDLVTLNVSGAPLADVLARVARQTRETIVADQALGGTITLHVRKAPLRQVLGQIADQTGAFARIHYAVGGSEGALSRLQSSLRQGQPLEQVGWTNLSARAVGGEQPPGAVVRHAGGPPGAEPAAGTTARKVGLQFDREGGPGTVRATLTATDADGVVRTIDLAPERLVMETGVAANLTSTDPIEPAAGQAAMLAHQVGGRWSTLYALEASPLPPGGLPPSLKHFGWASTESGASQDGPPVPGDMDATLRRHRFDQLTRLTPEQRARAAAQQPGPGMRFEVDVER